MEIKRLTTAKVQGILQVVFSTGADMWSAKNISRKARTIKSVLLGSIALIAVAGLVQPVALRAAEPLKDTIAKEVAIELTKWTAGKLKEGYDEYVKMQEARKEQKKAEEKLKSQKEFEAEWYKKHAKELKQKENELKAKAEARHKPPAQDQKKDQKKDEKKDQKKPTQDQKKDEKKPAKDQKKPARENQKKKVDDKKKTN